MTRPIPTGATGARPRRELYPMVSCWTYEDECLRQSWDRYPRHLLETQWVAGLEDPRINCQSILSRALIIDSLWPGEHTERIDAELRFGAVLSWLLRQLEGGGNRWALMNALNDGAGAGVPRFVRETHQWLQADARPVVDYVCLALSYPDPDRPEHLLCESALDTFNAPWHAALRLGRAERIRVLEAGCGAANDYRFIDQRGLSRFVSYTGLDVSTRSIAAASARFPSIDFRVGSILDSGLPDGAFEYVFAHDLLEHLSPPALERGLSEIVRLSGRQAWLHLFNACRGPSHHVEPVGKYHWNTLSLEALCRSLEKLGCDVEIVHIARFLHRKFCGCQYHNPRAATLLVSRR